MVGMAGFEPTTPGPPVKCATGLRYMPDRANPYSLKDVDASGNFPGG